MNRQTVGITCVAGLSLLVACGVESSTDGSTSGETGEEECPELVWSEGALLRPSSAEEMLAMPAYTRIEGHLSLTDVPGVTDLGFLACLGQVDGNLGISMPDLETLDGLERLHTVSTHGDPWAGTLVVEDNPKLLSTEGLAGLRHTDGLVIRDNPMLTSLDPIGIETAGYVELARNEALVTVGLRYLKSVETLQVGRRDCRGTDEDPLLSGNPALVEIDGLDALTSFDHLGIVGNPQLVSIDGLAGLGGPDAGGVRYLEVVHNESLPHAHVVDVQAQLGWEFTTVCENLDGPVCTECEGPRE